MTGTILMSIFSAFSCIPRDLSNWNWATVTKFGIENLLKCRLKKTVVSYCNSRGCDVLEIARHDHLDVGRPQTINLFNRSNTLWSPFWIFSEIEFENGWTSKLIGTIALKSRLFGLGEIKLNLTPSGVLRKSKYQPGLEHLEHFWSLYKRIIQSLRFTLHFSHEWVNKWSDVLSRADLRRSLSETID